MPDEFDTDKATDVGSAVLAFKQHVVTGPFDPNRDECDSARQSIGDTVRETIRSFGDNRRRWPKALLQAAAPFDALAQLALGGTEAKRVYTRAPASAIHPTNVRTHRPHNSNAGVDWTPVLPTNDLAIPDWK
jgi:hypothetical protein